MSDEVPGVNEEPRSSSSGRRDRELVLFTVGVTLAIVFVLMLIGAGLSYSWFNRVAHEGARFVEAELPDIVATWDADAFIRLGSPGQDEKSVQITRQVFEWFSRMGNVESLGSPVGNATVHFQTPAGLTVTAAFSVEGQFEEGPATLVVTVARVNGRWYMSKITMHSDKMLLGEGD